MLGIFELGFHEFSQAGCETQNPPDLCHLITDVSHWCPDANNPKDKVGSIIFPNSKITKLLYGSGMKMEHNRKLRNTHAQLRSVLLRIHNGKGISLTNGIGKTRMKLDSYII
jgi:hypothetical protein